MLTDVDIFCYRNGKLTTINEGIVHNSFPERVKLQNKLMEKAGRQAAPAIIQDEFQVLFGCIKKEDAYYFMGPILRRNAQRRDG